MSTPPPGWYADPERDDLLRWWDGTAWGEQRRPVNPPAAPPPGPGAPMPPAPAPGAWGQPPTQPGWSTSPASQPAGISPHGERLADPGQRFAAFLLDAVLVSVMMFVLLFVGIVAAFPLRAIGAVGGILAGVTVVAAGGAVIALYVLLTFVAEGRTGQSYGKMVMDIAVVGADTAVPIGTWPAVGRGLIRGLGSSIYVLFLGVLWITWDPMRQGWHDKAVRSVVVQRPTPTLNPVAFLKHVWQTPPPR